MMSAGLVGWSFGFGWLGWLAFEFRNVISQDWISIGRFSDLLQLESLILAQNERWRQA